MAKLSFWAQLSLILDTIVFFIRNATIVVIIVLGTIVVIIGIIVVIIGYNCLYHWAQFRNYWAQLSLLLGTVL